MTGNTKMLPCPLTDKERLGKSAELVSCHQELVELDERKAQLMAEMRETSKGLKKRIGELAKELFEGVELRSVPVMWRMDYGAGLKQMRRMDTGEPVGQPSPLSHEERQLALPGQDAISVLEQVRQEQEVGS